MPSSIQASAVDLKHWADTTLDAQSIFPELIRRLVHATGKMITHASFPAGKAVLLPGWDGTLVCGEASAFTPAGPSGWEFGVTSDVKSKADDDYEKRTLNPLGLAPAEAVFVFVTPRVWPKRDEWARSKSGEGVWREVRAYDARSLEEWLQLAPEVHLWISRLVGKRPVGAVDLESFWTDWSLATNPPLPSSLLLASRSAAVDQVKAWLAHLGAQPLVLQADTREEAVAFFASVVESLPTDERAALLARAVVVEDREAWNSLLTAQPGLVLIPLFDSAEATAAALRAGHSVFIPKSRGDTAGGDAVVLKPLRRRDAAEALVSAGIDAERAEQLAAHARTGMAALRRQLSHAPDPTWANADDARYLMAAMLAGAWSEDSSADRAVLERLGGRSYRDLVAELVRLANLSDPPVRRSGSAWWITNKADAWSLLAKFMLPEHLQAFADVAQEVLAAANPKFDLPDDQQWLASLHGKELPHSERLREGLADTAAMLGASGSVVVGSSAAQDYAGELVRAVLERANQDWRVWASLSPLLPLLAEAAPDAFLSGLEEALSGSKPLIADLFRDAKSGGWFPSSPHTGLLWALERLARSGQFVGRAALLLAHLAALDPGGSLGNRPAASLRQIFLPWLPQTVAPAERRLAILDNLRTRFPEVAWRLMVELLPRAYDHTGNAPAPKWREWPLPERRDRNVVEYANEVKGIVTRLLEDVGTGGARWSALVAALDDISRADHEAIVTGLTTLDANQLTATDRAAIADALRQLVSRHRSFADAEWAMPAEVVDHLEALHRKFESPDVILRHAYLFGENPQLITGREKDFTEHQKELEELQTGAATAIHASRGAAGLLELAAVVRRPEILGYSCGIGGVNLLEEDDLLDQHLEGSDAIARFVRGLCQGRTSKLGRVWGEAKLCAGGARWTPSQRAQLLMALPPDDATWTLAGTQGADTEAAYWRAANPWGIDRKSIPRATQQFVKYGRPFRAVLLLGTFHDPKAPWETTLVAEALEAAMRSDSTDDVIDSMFAYHATELLTWLASQGFEEVRLARLEWSFLPLFRGGQGRPEALHRALSSSPAFFVEVLCAAYRGDGDEPGQVDEAARNRARYAHDLLSAWRTIPGGGKGNGISAAGLLQWVREVREIAAQNQRAKVADYVMGEVLSGSPMGLDGAWPHEAVREVVEQVASSDLARGIGIGRRNSRGVVTRGPGGAQEEELALQYDRHAEKCADRWPRTAALLRGIARQYRGEALWHDQQDETD